ncbi:MAG TPA: hypothetical protein VHV08_06090 [Pirellulales bacterium]|nr:hypothetical protein [Pirellulales bacterium]
MVAQFVNAGLILSTDGQTTSALDDLVAACGWPALLQATPRRLRQELSLGVPKLSLVWLDDFRELSATTRLLEWLRDAHPAVPRLAVAYRLGGKDVEPAIRSAGVHFFVAIDGQIRELAEGLCRQWLPQPALQTPQKIARPRIMRQEWTHALCADRSLDLPP